MLSRLADYLEHDVEDEDFDMSCVFAHPPENPYTLMKDIPGPACIAGHGLRLFFPRELYHNIGDVGLGHYLKLYTSQRTQLFMPKNYYRHPYTRMEAVQVIRELIRTGDVKWPSLAT